MAHASERRTQPACLPACLPAWLCRLMDSLEIFSKVPVDPDTYYLVGLQVYGVPGFDFLSPIGTSGVTIAAALNPCVGGWLAGAGGRAGIQCRSAATLAGICCINSVLQAGSPLARSSAGTPAAAC